MTTLSRRAFLHATGAFALAAHGCNLTRLRWSERERVIAELAQAVAVSDTRAILAAAQGLSAALRAADQDPSEPQLEAAREAWRYAALAWQRAYAFRNGPIIEANAYMRSAFWPTRPEALRELIASDEALGPTAIEELGVDVKGVFAVEHLLFEGPGPGAPAWWLGERSQRVRSLARQLADSALAYAGRAGQALRDGESFATRFGQAGQHSLNLLVNQTIGTLETAAARRLDHVVATHANGTLRLQDVQGAPSGLSSEIPRVWLASIEGLYLGSPDHRGLSSLVAAAAPQVDAHLRRQLQAAVDSLRQLGAPLEQLVLRDPAPIAAAVRAIKQLETAMRVELVSALGITLTFVASDGD